MDDLCREIVTRSRNQERFAVGLLTHVQGSAPQKAGARLIVFPDGRMAGTVGGGCLEMETRRHALHALRTGEPFVFDLRLDDDFGWDDGLICGGRTSLLVTPHPSDMVDALAASLATQEKGERGTHITVLNAPDVRPGTSLWVGADNSIGRVPTWLADGARKSDKAVPTRHEQDGWRYLMEPVRPTPRLYLFGCGHIGTALVEMASRVGFAVTAIDDRIDYANVERLPLAAHVICDDLPRTAATLPTDSDTYFVIVTRGHRNDGKVLAAMLGRPHAYVGMIGSNRKVRIIRDGLIADGIATADQVAALHSPVGLDIGAESPQEIALSIAAELVAARRGRLAK